MALQPSIVHHSGLDVLMIAIRLLDDAHAVWEAAEQESHHALHAWFSDRHRPDPYLAYPAALDREEAAARDLERLCELAQPCHELLARDEPRASN
jgi:hypothetical protein